MSTRPVKSAKQASSTHSLNRRLGLYSLAAATAGVGILALAAPAEGEVVVTTKTVRIPLSSLGVDGVGISFANNGVDDVKLVLSSFSIFGNNGNSLKAVNAADGRGILGHFDFERFGSALLPGAKIGPSANFVSATCGGSYFECYNHAVNLAATHTSTFGTRNVSGPWRGSPKNGYLGVRFLINGETHYGWVRLMVSTQSTRRTMATVTAYAYETIANKPIVAGTAERPAAEVQLPENIQNQAGPSLGMLAAGADGLPVWRRDESLTAK
jgi:hypothetical protein